MPGICIDDFGLFSQWAVKTGSFFFSRRGEDYPIHPLWISQCCAALNLVPQPSLRIWELPKWGNESGAVLPFCDLLKWHQQLVLPTRTLPALQGLVEGSPTVISGWISSCVMWWQHTVTEWACSCLELLRYKHVAKASRGCGACCVCSVSAQWTKSSPLGTYFTWMVLKPWTSL